MAIGVVTLLFGATTVFAELQSALNRIWRVETAAETTSRPALLEPRPDRLLALALIFVVGFLLLVSLVVSAGLAALHGYLARAFHGGALLWELVNSLVALAVISFLIAMVYLVLPDVRLGWADVWGGALVTAILFSFGKFRLASISARPAWRPPTPGGRFARGAAAVGLLLLADHVPRRRDHRGPRAIPAPGPSGSITLPGARRTAARGQRLDGRRGDRATPGGAEAQDHAEEVSRSGALGRPPTITARSNGPRSGTSWSWRARRPGPPRRPPRRALYAWVVSNDRQTPGRRRPAGATADGARCCRRRAAARRAAMGDARRTGAGAAHPGGARQRHPRRTTGDKPDAASGGQLAPSPTSWSNRLAGAATEGSTTATRWTIDRVNWCSAGARRSPWACGVTGGRRAYHGSAILRPRSAMTVVVAGSSRTMRRSPRRGSEGPRPLHAAVSLDSREATMGSPPACTSILLLSARSSPDGLQAATARVHDTRPRL